MPRFRVGRSVPINAYDGNDPIFQGHSPAEVMKLVGLLNMGWHLTQVTYDQLQNVFAESERYWGEEDFLDRLRSDVWMLLMPPNVVVSAPDRPAESREGHTGLVRDLPSAPESAPEAEEAGEVPEDESGPQDRCSWIGTMGRCIEPAAGRWWSAARPRRAETAGPDVRAWCSIHGSEMEQADWHPVSEMWDVGS